MLLPQNWLEIFTMASYKLAIILTDGGAFVCRGLPPEHVTMDNEDELD